MPQVYNPTEEKVETKVFGSHFVFAPGQRKNMSEGHCNFIAMNRKETGLVILPAEFDPMNEEKYIEGYDKTPEGKEVLSDKKREGIQNLIDHYTWIIHNNQVSLRNDLVRKDPHTDPIKLANINASKGEIEAMRLVAKYKKLAGDENAVRAKEVEKLMNEIGPIGK
jgi:hypothetical protein